MILETILDEVGRPVATLEKGQTVHEAIAAMAQSGSSSLIITSSGTPAGIFTEHDVIRAFALSKGKPFSEIAVEDAMTNKLISAKSADELDASIALMLKADIRHLPVMDSTNTVTSILHLCDLVHYRMGVLASEIGQLEDYVKDLHGALTD